jgi:hypothetical protein
LHCFHFAYLGDDFWCAGIFRPLPFTLVCCVSTYDVRPGVADRLHSSVHLRGSVISVTSSRDVRGFAEPWCMHIR